VQALGRHRFVRSLALVVSLVVLPLGAADAAKTFAEGQKAERAGHMAQAYLLYSQAAALDPTNQFYRMKSEAASTSAGTASSIAASIVQRPSPESSTVPEK
jgi:predicted TPR repeat methyltransferase